MRFFYTPLIHKTSFMGHIRKTAKKPSFCFYAFEPLKQTKTMFNTCAKAHFVISYGDLPLTVIVLSDLFSSIFNALVLGV